MLHEYLDTAARARGRHIAAVEPSSDGRTAATITYEQFDRLSDRLRDRLSASGVGVGDRVGVYLHKSIDSLVALFGVLKCGAAYVPVDVSAPASRNAYIHADCSVKAVVLESAVTESYMRELQQLGSSAPVLITLQRVGGGAGLAAALDQLDTESPVPASTTRSVPPSALAYILYTSGSTGRPKGVMLSHGNATSFVEWCARYFEPAAADVFSSHAPFHFDLSILDIYVPIKYGARVVLIGEAAGRDARALANIIERQSISFWYSAPSILSLLAQYPALGEHDLLSLRAVLFAGEVFPVAKLRALKRSVPKPRFFNLYGPTETNVCTCYEIPAEIPDDRADAYPIGTVCDHLEGMVVDEAGNGVSPGLEGELCIAGSNVMEAYWGLPERTRDAFVSAGGKRWYKTGDIVVGDADSVYRYVGRRDRMVKKRGYRVELGEIEACLHRHDGIREAAVVALPSEDLGVRIVAHLVTSDYGNRLSLIALKSFCALHIPTYMIPDQFRFHSVLPKTSTDKLDYQTLIKDS